MEMLIQMGTVLEMMILQEGIRDRIKIMLTVTSSQNWIRTQQEKEQILEGL